MKSLESLALYGRARAVEASFMPALPALDATKSPNMGADAASQEGNAELAEQRLAISRIAAELTEEPIVI